MNRPRRSAGRTGAPAWVCRVFSDFSESKVEGHGKEVPMTRSLDELIKSLPAIPFLFVGSGLTRRYYALPNWRELLEVFARRLRDDDFALARYENRVGPIADPLPEVAELIARDFNARWFEDPRMRDVDEEYLPAIRSNTPPFKAEIATYIQRRSVPVQKYEGEIAALSGLSQKSLAGIITTNYDCFLERVMDGYKTYVGQEELIFSAVYGLAEIYKIHGCISRPSSLVITAKDYEDFNSKNQYLASKLMTLFLEYPIIFIGYSVNDPNIKSILRSVVGCLSNANIDKLRDRFVFVEHGENDTPEIGPHSMIIDDKHLTMTKVRLSNYAELYNALAQKRSTLPVKVLRFLKKECYDYVLTNKPTRHFQVALIDDERIDEESLAIAVGTLSGFARKGLTGITSAEWYRHIVLDDLSHIPADELLEIAFPRLQKAQNALPLHKLLSQATRVFPDAEAAAPRNFNALVSNSIIKGREKIVQAPNRSVRAIWKQEGTLEKRTRHIAHLYEHEIELEALEAVLVNLYAQYSDPLSNPDIDDGAKSHIRRLIRFYDFLKYGQKKSLGSGEQLD